MLSVHFAPPTWQLSRKAFGNSHSPSSSDRIINTTLNSESTFIDTKQNQNKNINPHVSYFGNERHFCSCLSLCFVGKLFAA